MGKQLGWRKWCRSAKPFGFQISSSPKPLGEMKGTRSTRSKSPVLSFFPLKQGTALHTWVAHPINAVKPRILEPTARKHRRPCPHHVSSLSSKCVYHMLKVFWNILDLFGALRFVLHRFSMTARAETPWLMSLASRAPSPFRLKSLQQGEICLSDSPITGCSGKGLS